MANNPLPFIPLTENVRLCRFVSTIRMNYRNQANLNPLVMVQLRETCPGKFAHIVLGLLDEQGIEAGMVAVGEPSEGAVKLSMAVNEKTALVTLGRLVAKFPSLRVEKGRYREFPVTARTVGESTFLVINLKESEVVLPEPRKKKNSSGSEAPAGQQTVVTAGDTKAVKLTKASAQPAAPEAKIEPVTTSPTESERGEAEVPDTQP